MANLLLSADEEDGMIIAPSESDTHSPNSELWLVGRLLTDRSINFGAMKNRLADV